MLVPGLFNSALQLPDADAAVAIPAPADADVQTACSLSLWFRVPAGTNGRIVGRTQPGAAPACALDVTSDGDLLATCGATALQTVATIADDAWHHLLLSIDTNPAQPQAVLYLDGQRAAAAALPPDYSLAAAGAPLSFGATPADGETAAVSGVPGLLLDDFRLFHARLDLVHAMMLAEPNADADRDALTNLAEFQQGTDPNNPDTDGDLMPDGWEHANGLDPLVDDAALDTFNIGVSNLDAYLEGRNPHNGTLPDTSGVVRLVLFTPLE